MMPETGKYAGNAGRQTKKGGRFVLPILALLVLAACARHGQPDDPAALIVPNDWHGFGRTGAEQHYSPLDQIATRTIADLKLAWFADLPPENTATGPVEGEGKVFITTGHGHIRAFDGVTGKPLWDYDARAREASSDMQLQMGWGPKGLAYWQGRVFLGTHDGRVVAVNAADGKLIWQARDYPAGAMRYTDGPVRVFGGKVIIGHGGADYSPIRGYVTAYDALSGKRLWRFYTVPGNPADGFEDKAMAMAAKTWTGQWWKHGGGGTAWNAFSYDPKLNLIYIGVGNGYPYNQAIRSPQGGDNLFLASIVAVKADTGEYVWHYQVCPGEQWDCTATMDMTLATLKIGGKDRKVLMQAPKNGFFYVLDRATGKLISAARYADKVTWASGIDMKTGRPIENPGIRYHGRKGMFELWPGVRGAHSWLPQSYSPRTGLVYIPVIEGAARIGDDGLDLAHLPPALSTGVIVDPDPDLPGAHRSFLKAWDPVRQKEAWRVPLPGNWPGGTMATAGNLVFQGRLDGKFVAYDARSGKALWTFATGAPIVAPPISYRIGETQYVTVLTGNGAGGGGLFSSANAALGIDYRQVRRVLTFTLKGTVHLPPPQPPTPRLADPAFTPDPAKVAAGARAFAACMTCHGYNAAPAGTAPDLRKSPYILDAAAFRSVVRDGALKSAGMPPFRMFDDATLEAIREYLRARAHRPDSGGPSAK